MAQVISFSDQAATVTRDQARAAQAISDMVLDLKRIGESLLAMAQRES
jgi:hypothetical protein